VADARAHRVNILNMQGKVLDRWGMKGILPGEFNGPHSICADGQGRVYVGEGDGQRVQKFVRR